MWDILKDGVPISAELGSGRLFFQIVVGVPLGIISALKPTPGLTPPTWASC